MAYKKKSKMQKHFSKYPWAYGFAAAALVGALWMPFTPKANAGPFMPCVYPNTCAM